jgi:hypothetical protein
MKYQKGDKIIDLLEGKSYVVKYVLNSSVVVCSGKGYDMPLRFEWIVPCSTIMEELI